MSLDIALCGSRCLMLRCVRWLQKLLFVMSVHPDDAAEETTIRKERILKAQENRSRVLRSARSDLLASGKMTALHFAALEHVRRESEKDLEDILLVRLPRKLANLGYSIDQMNDMLDFLAFDVKPHIHFQPALLTKLMKDPYLRNVHEIKNKGDDELIRRRKVERGMFSEYCDATPDPMRPKYGYLNYSGCKEGDPSALRFGSSYVVLKTRCLAQLTCTSVDTINEEPTATMENAASILMHWTDEQIQRLVPAAEVAGKQRRSPALDNDDCVSGADPASQKSGTTTAVDAASCIADSASDRASIYATGSGVPFTDKIIGGRYYKEFCFHGPPIDIAADVDYIIADPTHKPLHQKAFKEFAEFVHVPLDWMNELPKYFSRRLSCVVPNPFNSVFAKVEKKNSAGEIEWSQEVVLSKDRGIKDQYYCNVSLRRSDNLVVSYSKR